MTPLSLPKPKEMPEKSVYLFSENGKHLYAGRSRRLRDRIWQQSRIEGIPFAFRLARKETDQTQVTYKTKGSREDLMKNPEFQEAMRDALSRIQKMEVRFVEESDPVKQTLLEIYVAVVLEGGMGRLLGLGGFWDSWRSFEPDEHPDQPVVTLWTHTSNPHPLSKRV